MSVFNQDRGKRILKFQANLRNGLPGDIPGLVIGDMPLPLRNLINVIFQAANLGNWPGVTIVFGFHLNGSYCVISTRKNTDNTGKRPVSLVVVVHKKH